MSLRPSEIVLVAGEIASALAGRPVQKVVQPDARTLLLGFPSAWLLISLDPRHGRVHLLDGKPPGTGEAAPSYCMLLRKELGGLRLESVETVLGERALALRFAGRGPAHELRRGLLIFLYGAGARCVLVDERGLPLGALGGRRPDPAVPVELPPPRSLPPERDPPPRFVDTDATASVSERIAALYSEASAGSSVEAARAEALAAVGRDRKRLVRLVEGLEGDLQRAEDAAALRRRADLLLAHLSEVPRGAAEVVLPDDFDEGQPVRITLDPSRTPQDNAARFYHAYRRLVRGRTAILERLGAARERLAAMDERLAALESADAQSLGALTLGPTGQAGSSQTATARRAGPVTRAAPGLQSSLQSRSKAKPKGSDTGRKPPYRRFRSASGADILVGKGAERNDELTFHVARGNDLWLHTRDLPGAHVVVPLAGRPVDEITLLDAATLAVYFSPARPASSLDERAVAQVQADVTYALRKLVRKPKGAGPGRVSVSGGRTLRVRLEPDRLHRLLASREGASD